MMLERERGQLDQGIAIMEQSVDEMPTLTAFRCVLARLYAERGSEAEAGAILKAVAETDFEVLPDNDKLYGWSLLGEVCSALRDPTHAPRLYELLSPYAWRNVVCHPGCAIGSVSRYLGVLATLLERFDEAARHFEDALAMNERMGARPWLAHTQHDYARLLIAHGTTDDRAKGTRCWRPRWPRTASWVWPARSREPSRSRRRSEAPRPPPHERARRLGPGVVPP